MMKNWEESMKLNEHHNRLKMFVGEWDVVTKHWMQPGAEPNVSKAESECDLIFNGRYVRQTYEGVIEMPDASGKMVKQNFKGESMDFRVTEKGKVYLLEPNPNPDLAFDEDFCESAKAGGLSYEKLIQKIINLGRRYIRERAS